MKTYHAVGLLGIACIAYALYQIDEPWLTIVVGLLLLVGAYGVATDKQS